MQLNIQHIKSFLAPLVNVVICMFTAAFVVPGRDWLLPILFLLLPFIDKRWRMVSLGFSKPFVFRWVVVALFTAGLIIQNAEIYGFLVVMVISAALPEEWFFRGYLQSRFGNTNLSIIITSVLFTCMHYIVTFSTVSLLVIFPSLVFGYVYKKTDDLITIVMLHALSNIIYYLYFEEYTASVFFL